MHPGDVRLRRLQTSCAITLERYVAVANETCKMASRLGLVPPPSDLRLDLFTQKKREERAHEAYEKARNALFAALEAEGASDAEEARLNHGW